MPEMDGYERPRLLRARYPDIRVWALTMYDSELAIIRLLQLGVRGFLKKRHSSKRTSQGYQKHHDNGYYYSAIRRLSW